jgi:hypothetical protein
MNADEQMRLLEDLQCLLQDQLLMARKGNYRRLEVLTQQAVPIVEDLRRSSAFKKTEFKPQCRQINELYKKLQLAVAGEKNSIETQQRQTADSRKTLRVYLNS